MNETKLLGCEMQVCQQLLNRGTLVVLEKPLSPARWHDKHTYLSSLEMLGTTQLNSGFWQIT